MNHKKIFGAAFLAWFIFWLVPRAIGPTPQSSTNVDDELMIIWRNAYTSSCASVNATMNALFGEGTADRFCVCMADRYSAEMSRSEAIALARSGTMPPRILAQREKLQDECLDEVTSSNTRSRELRDIVINGTYNMLEEVLKSGAYSKNEVSEALLSTAVLNKVPEAELLLLHGADPNYRVGGFDNLTMAVRKRNFEVMPVLLRNGANPNSIGNFDWTPLHHTIVIEGSFDEGIKVLLANGADVDATTSLKVTALHRAASFCKPSAARLLLQYGANKELKDKYGQTALDRARQAGCLDVVSILE